MQLITKLEQSIHDRNDPDVVKSMFTNVCLKALDPGLNSLTFYKADYTGEKYNKPKFVDGTPNPHWPHEGGEPAEPPRDKDERKDFFDGIKQAFLADWIKRVEDGEFDTKDAVKASPTTTESDTDVKDVTNLDMGLDEGQTEEKIDEGVEIAKQHEPTPEPTKEEKKAEKIKKIIEESTPVDNSLVDLHNRPLEEQVSRLLGYNHEVGTPGVMKMLRTLEQVNEHLKGKSHPVIRLREAIEEIARGTTDVDQDDRIIKMEGQLFAMNNDIKRLSRIQEEQHNRQNAQCEVMESIKEKLVTALKKVPDIIKAEILKKFS